MKINQLFLILSCCGVLLSCASVSAIPQNSSDWEQVVNEDEALWERRVTDGQIVDDIYASAKRIHKNIEEIENIKRIVLDSWEKRDCSKASFAIAELRERSKIFTGKEHIYRDAIDEIKNKYAACYR